MDDAPKDMKRRKFELPSIDEQQQLNHTQHLLQQNLIQLQLQEMITEVTPSKLYESKYIKSRLDIICEVLMANALPSGDDVISQEWINDKGLTGIKLENYTNTAVSLSYMKPLSIDVSGSFASQTVTTPFVNIDLVLKMPGSCFNERDILNHVYYDKRKLYIAAVAHILTQTFNTGESESEKDLPLACPLSFTFMKGDVRKPIILLTLRLKHKGTMEIRIIPVAPAESFKVTQLNALKSNVRSHSWLKSIQRNKENGQLLSGDMTSALPTPNYNAAILEDLAVPIQAKIIRETCTICPISRQLQIIMKIWLAQRGLRFGFDGIDGHTISLIIAYMVQTRRLLSTMTLVAALQSAFKFLSEVDFTNSVLSFKSTEVVPRVDDFGAVAMILLHPVVNKDVGKQIDYNCLWRVSMSSLNALQAEAQKSLLMLQSLDDLSFRLLFLEKYDITSYGDLFFRIDMPSSLPIDQWTEHDSPSLAIGDILLWQYCSKLIYDVLRTGLGDRITSIRIGLTEKCRSNCELSSSSNSFSRPWSALTVDESREDTVTDVQNKFMTMSHLSLVVGLCLHTENASRKIDKDLNGDTIAEGEGEEQISKFRMFWGDKCQLRRFQDGTIVEAVVWNNFGTGKGKTEASKNVAGGSSVVNEIVRYLLSTKLPICDEASISSSLQKFSESKKSQSQRGSDHAMYSSQEHATFSRLATEALDALRGILTSQLKDMPLIFDNVSSIDPATRYTASHPSSPHPIILASHEAESTSSMRKLQGKKLSLLAKPIAVLGRLEKSGKWPSDAMAASKLKLAMMIRTSELLTQQFQITAVVHEDVLDILYRGLIFRLHIITENDSTTSLSSATCSSSVKVGMMPSSMIRSSLHHQAVRTVVSGHACYAGTVRYMMHWLSGHYLSGLLHQEAVEIIVASIFLHPYPKLYAPTTAEAGLLMTLRKLASFNWDEEAIIVDFDSSMPPGTKSDILKHMKSSKSQAISIYTSYACQRDSHGVMHYQVLNWDYNMNKMELKILIGCAQDSAGKLTLLFEGSNRLDSMGSEIDADDIFSGSFVTDRSNVLLSFSNLLTKKYTTYNGTIAPKYAVTESYANMPSSEQLSLRSLLVRDNSPINPIQYDIVANLRSQFSRFALFFWSEFEGSHIVVIWKPAAFLPTKMSTLECSFKLPVTDSNETSSSSKSTGTSICNVTELLSKIVSSCDGYIQSFKVC